MKKQPVDIAIIICACIVLILLVVLLWPIDKNNTGKIAEDKAQTEKVKQEKEEKQEKNEQEIKENSLLSDTK